MAVVSSQGEHALTRDANMHVVPEFAESWRQIDPVTYECHLREGVHFHDGSRMTAEDVTFSLERVLGGKIGGQTTRARTCWDR
jgi:peptide/nickel transport system substrate-binding protein